MKFSRRNVLVGGVGVLAAPGIGGMVLAPRGVEANAVREDSLWTTEIPALPTFPTYSNDREVDLAIVGAGYTGLSCAYYAKKFRPDWNIVVLDSHRVGSGASSRNTGVVDARQVGIDDQGLPRRGLQRFREFLDNEQVACDFAPTSTLMVASTRSQAEQKQANLLPDQTWVPADELSERISSDYYYGAVDARDYFKIHPAKLVRGHVEAVGRLGVELFERSPVLRVNNGDPAELETREGRLRAKHVLIATNAYTPRLGVQSFNMFPIHQYSLATRVLTPGEIAQLGLDRWSLRFEDNTLPVTFSLTPSGRFFVRVVICLANLKSCAWSDRAHRSDAHTL